MYSEGLGWSVLGRFEDHDGFDGVMLGCEGSGHHFEFTTKRAGHVEPSPTPEDLVVLYLPVLDEWQRACAAVVSAGFVPVAPFNPYWAEHGRTFEDPDGYRTVLQHASWSPQFAGQGRSP